MTNNKVGLIGATGLVGTTLIPLLLGKGAKVHAVCRNGCPSRTDGLSWSTASALHEFGNDPITDWLSTAPIDALPRYFSIFERNHARRIVALSSTSRFTKADSSDTDEAALSHKLKQSEEDLRSWAESQGIEWVILRPTLIYGHGQDKNIAEIARIIRRFGFFPMLGSALGKRQPIHVEDVAAACLSAMYAPQARNRAYNISGGETLPYREMVSRVFTALRRRPRLVPIPLVAFKFAVFCLRLLPRYRNWSSAMAERMNHDLVFDHSDAARDFGFSPRLFELNVEDIPS